MFVPDEGAVVLIRGQHGNSAQLFVQTTPGACMLFTSAAAAHAGTLEVNVPFAFMVGSRHMPAGVYRIE